MNPSFEWPASDGHIRVGTGREHRRNGQKHGRSGGNAGVEWRESASRQRAVARVPVAREQVEWHREVERLVFPQSVGGDALPQHDRVGDGRRSGDQPEGDICRAIPRHRATLRSARARSRLRARGRSEICQSSTNAVRTKVRVHPELFRARTASN